MGKLAGVLSIIAGALLGLYVGGWCMFVQPILQCCYAEIKIEPYDDSFFE